MSTLPMNAASQQAAAYASRLAIALEQRGWPVRKPVTVDEAVAALRALWQAHDASAFEAELAAAGVTGWRIGVIDASGKPVECAAFAAREAQIGEQLFEADALLGDYRREQMAMGR